MTRKSYRIWIGCAFLAFLGWQTNRLAAQTGLIQHLDASVEESILTGSNNEVTLWNDLSEAGNNAIPQIGTVYKVTEGDRVWLDFGESRNSLQLFGSAASDSWLDQSAGAGGFCIFLVFKISSFHSDWNDILGNTSTALEPYGFGMRYSKSGSAQNYLAGIRQDGPQLEPGDVVIFALKYDASANIASFWNSKLDAEVSKSISHADFSMGSTVSLGTTTNSNRFFKGCIGEVSIYNEALDDEVFVAVRENLSSKWLSTETDPPLPNPAGFEIVPTAIYGTTISMLANTGSDENGGIEYYFEEVSANPGGDDSGWQPFPYYSDGGLAPDTEYRYRVKMRDAFGNSGEASEVYAATTSDAVPWKNDLDSGAYYGYQAWHRGPEEGWPHWFDNGIPDAAHMSGDNWPDLSEYPILYETQLDYPDASPVFVYSTNDYETIDVHIRWMKEYGIKGCYIQRQQLNIDNPANLAYMDRKAMHVRRACEKYGVKFCMMPCNNDKTDGGRGQEYVDIIINDWKHCVDDLKITESPMYMHQDGKPVIGFWGLGFSNRDMTVGQATEILDFFQSAENTEYRVYVMGGLHHFWRTNPKEGWMPVYERLDMISPWRTIFYDAYSQTHIDRMNGDKVWCDSRDIDYNPVVSPGASTAYQNSPDKRNNYPRNGGHYLWKQAYEVCKMGNKFMYIAMYDEIDEGTAMYKLAETQEHCPVVNPALVPLNEDGYTLPADWYLQIGTQIQKMMDGRIALTDKLPITPFELNMLSSPENGAEGVSALPMLAWSNIASADEYRVYLKKGSSDISESDLISSQADTSLLLTSSLENNSSYFWRVDVEIDSWLVEGPVWNFTVEAVGVKKEYAASIGLYPNPAQKSFFISGIEGVQKYTILDIHGRKVHGGWVKNQQEIPTEDLNKGMYIILIQNQTRRLVKY